MSRLPGECWRTPRKQETKLSRRRALALLSSLSQLLSSLFRIKLCSNLCSASSNVYRVNVHMFHVTWHIVIWSSLIHTHSNGYEHAKAFLIDLTIEGS